MIIVWQTWFHRLVVLQCCRKCKILARPMDHLWLMVGWSVSFLGSPPIKILLRPCNQSKSGQNGPNRVCILLRHNGRLISVHLWNLSTFIHNIFCKTQRIHWSPNGPSMVGPWVARWIHGSHLATGRPCFSSTESCLWNKSLLKHRDGIQTYDWVVIWLLLLSWPTSLHIALLPNLQQYPIATIMIRRY